MSTPSAACRAPGREATQASSQISKAIWIPPTAKRTSPKGRVFPANSTLPTAPAAQGLNCRGS
jgi:hypothetical protein